MSRIVKLEASQTGVVLVHIGVPDMDQAMSRKTSADLVKVVLMADEGDAQAPSCPHPLLVGDGSVRRAPHDIAQGERSGNQVHPDRTRGVALFECAVDVKAQKRWRRAARLRSVGLPMSLGGHAPRLLVRPW